jgi:hypothetical protein
VRAMRTAARTTSINSNGNRRKRTTLGNVMRTGLNQTFTITIIISAKLTSHLGSTTYKSRPLVHMIYPYPLQYRSQVIMLQLKINNKRGSVVVVSKRR